MSGWTGWIAAAVALAVGTAAAQDVRVGSLVDHSGVTATEGRIAGVGKQDAVAYVNKTGGINGKRLIVDTFDYGYDAARVVQQYRKWRQDGVQAIQGYGTEDTDLLTPLAAEDKVPLWSLAALAQLADPQGKGPKRSKPAPYTFSGLPSYSDGVRALLQWAAEDWKKKGGKGRPRYAHMGDNHPYANAAKQAGEEYAKELGFDLLPAIPYPMVGGELEAQCLSLRLGGVNYAFLANTTAANVALLRSCQELGIEIQFLANMRGMHEAGMKSAGRAADGLVFVAGTLPWGAEVPGMKVLQEVSRNSDPSGREYRPLPYARAACAVFYMADAMKWADQNGGMGGENIRKGIYSRKNWVPYGLDGVCGPANWTDSDHRAVTQVGLLQVSIKGATDQGEIGELMRSGAMALKPIFSTEIARKAEWLGW